MRIQVLGGHGGLSQGFSTTSFLIDGHILLDAGSVAGTLSIEDQAKINHIFISHSHLDHIKDLAFICDNCFGMRPGPFEVYTHATVKKILMDHLFNETIWPDFTKLPTKDNPTIVINAINPGTTYSIEGYKVTGIKVKHPNDAMGFIIEKGSTSVLFTVDTAATDEIWKVAKTVKNLKAIFTEVSFPNNLSKVAILSDHHTPNSLKDELKKMPLDIPVILTHLKPNFREKLFQEIAALGEKRLKVLERDGEVFEF